MVYIFVSLNEDFMHSVAQNLISSFYFLSFFSPPFFVLFCFVFEVRGKQQGSHSHFHIALLSSCQRCKCVVKGCKEIEYEVCI